MRAATAMDIIRASGRANAILSCYSGERGGMLMGEPGAGLQKFDAFSS
jgi:hypothetical protein